MSSAVSRSVSSPSGRRVHYQAQLSNASLSLSQSFSMVDPSNLNESVPSFIYTNPLVTIIYSTTSSSKGSAAPVKTTEIKKHIISGTCTFIRLIYGDNQQILLNSYSSCRRLLDHLKPVIGVQQDETIDLMDNEGKLKELNTHGEEYASAYLTARNTYYVFKVEIVDLATNEKRYTAYFNMDQIDQKLYSILSNSLNSLNSLNKSVKGKRPLAGTSKQNSFSQPTSTTTQAKNKRTSGRK